MKNIISLLFGLLLVSGTAGAQLLQYSSDTGTLLDDVFVRQNSLVRDYGSGPLSASEPLALPAGTDLVGWDHKASGEQLFSVDVSVVLESVMIRRSDIGQLNGGIYSVVFDGAGSGLPAGATIDAVTFDGTDLLISFDIDVDLGGFTAADEDLVRFDGTDFSLELDLSEKGVPGQADLEAAHRQSDGTYLLSFSIHGSAGGAFFADEDVLGFDPTGDVWTLVYDGSEARSGWEGAAIDALSVAGDDLFKDGFESAQLLMLTNDLN